MDSFARLDIEERKKYFEVASDKLGINSQLIDKDFWVCWILKRLFSMKDIGEHLTFKGGTSLSKVYKIIGRFSEDVDVSIERSYLGYGGDMEPEKGSSNKERKRRIEGLIGKCKEAITDIFYPELRSLIQESLETDKNWKLELDTEDQTNPALLFHFPSVSPLSKENYLKSVIKIEMGARSDHWPVEMAEITPYVVDAVPDAMTDRTVNVRVLSAERTFWEKATILHKLYHFPEDKPLPIRMTRHYYDIYEMVQSAILERALDNIDLLTRVAEHTSTFFRSPAAKYDEAKPGTLKLVPKPNQIPALESDYQQMQPMFFKESPSFESILEALKTVEDRINKIKS